MKKYAILLLLGACASAPEPRTKLSDKSMRLLIDVGTVEPAVVASLQASLVNDGTFSVVDRGVAYKSIKAEQERTHIHESGRFENRQKYAHWGKLYGVGSVLIPHVDCGVKNSPLFQGYRHLDCVQTLTLVDTNTAEVLVAVTNNIEGESTTEEYFVTPDWDKIVEKLSAKYEKAFVEHKISPRLEQYQRESEEHAKTFEKNRRLPASDTE